ncbi:MAG: response regulator [Candidatus Buchananbacteria bacterium]
MAKRKILIIEDEKSLAKLIYQAFDPALYEIILAGEVKEGMKKAIFEKPDLIVLDIILAGNNGFRLLADLKSNQETKKIPVIILSNLGQAEEIRKGKELGAIDYLVKADFSIDEVVKRITDASKK